MRRIGVGLACGLLVSGCASTSERIGASYVSPLTYESYDCEQILAERERIATRVHDVAGAQNRQAKNEQIATGVGLVLFWPALFMLVGPDRREELANLKGQYEALEQASTKKRCDATKARSRDGKPRTET